MPSDDELRRVAEDMRALARSLGRDIRAAVDRTRTDMYGSGGAGSAGRLSAREDLAAARRAAGREFRRARSAMRHSARPGHDLDDPGGQDQGEDRYFSPARPGPGYPPRWDNWGRRRGHDPVGVGPPSRGWSGRPCGTPWPSWSGFGSHDRRPAPVAIPQPPLRHRHDGSTLLGLLALVFGLAWLAAGTRLAEVSTEAVVAIALMVLGAATVVTARTDWALSRRSWPVLGGAALAVALLALSASPGMPVGFRHLEFGSRTIIPTTWADLPAGIHGGFGGTVVDLSRLTAPLGAPKTLTVDGAAGRLEIILPANLKVLVDARVTAGQIRVNDVPLSGLARVYRETLDPTAPDPALTLRVQSGFGSVAITQVGAASTGPSSLLTPPSLPPRPELAPVPPGGVR
ncbi:MAG: LiaF-related protein [Actinomycetota bacterium]|nr:LiaF-related protein [Actinomycetota bacterium]